MPENQAKQRDRSVMSKRLLDEIRFWENFITHWERVHGVRAPARAYDALSFARLRLKCLSEETALDAPDSTDTLVDQ